MHALHDWQPAEQAVELHWADGHHSRFHYVWLRYHCRCPQCVHPETGERILERLQPHTPKTFHVQGHELTIQWSDHQGKSRYPLDWLRAACYCRPPTTAPRRPWNRVLPRFAYASVMRGPKRLEWMLALRDTGVALLTQCPRQPGTVEQVARQVGRIRETNFGHTFVVRCKAQPNNNAYTALALPLHTDLPNWELPPGIQFLHCIDNSATGGDSVVADGVAVVAALRKHPDALQQLCQTQVWFQFRDSQVHIAHCAPIIELDKMGELKEFRYNNALIGHCAAGTDVPGWFAAVQRLQQTLEDPAITAHFRLEPGDLLAFDNRRMLHGRTTFDPTSGSRFLQGCYVDLDDLHSQIRTADL